MKTANGQDERALVAAWRRYLSMLIVMIAVLISATGCSSLSEQLSARQAQRSRVYGGPVDVVVLTPDGGYDVFDADTCVQKRHVGNPYRYSSDSWAQEVN
jgi:hypothetical protein